MNYKIPLYNEKLQKTGVIDSNGMVFRKHISNPGYHQLQEPPAWAVDTVHLDMLEALGGSMVVLTFPGGRRIKATLELFRKHGAKVDRGHGLQTGLPLNHWSVF